MFSFEALRGLLPQRLLPPIPAWEAGHGLRDAAVIAPLVALPTGIHVIYTLRRADLTHHAGEVSFPGGRREGEEAPLACALREFEEETGLAGTSVEILGALPARTSLARYRVQPFVGLLHAAAPYVPQESEVDRVLELPLSVLADEAAWEELEVERANGQRFKMPSLRIDEGALLWGLTARFTLDLLACLRGTPLR